VRAGADGARLEAPEGVDVVVDAVEELLDDDGVFFRRGREPLVEAGRRMAPAALAVAGCGLVERDGALAQESVKLEARIADQVVDRVVRQRRSLGGGVTGVRSGPTVGARL